MIINKAIKRAKKIKYIRHKHGRSASYEILIHRTNQHIAAYVIDLNTLDAIFSVSSAGKENDAKQMNKLNKSIFVGKSIADLCNQKKIKPVINVAEYKFHGRVKILVEEFMKNLITD